MFVSILEVKGLIMPQEMNRRNIDKSLNFEPVIEVRLEDFRNQDPPLRQASKATFKQDGERKPIIFDTHANKEVANSVGEFLVDLGKINHSGKVEQKDANYSSQNSLYSKETEQFIHILVKDK